MLEKGSFSFVALLVINPVVILLYQNCSLLPVTQSELAARDMAPQKRMISSVSTPAKIDLNKLRAAAKETKPNDCDSSHKNCPVVKME